MAAVDPISGVSVPPASTGSGLLVLLAAVPADERQSLLTNLTEAFPNQGLLIASPEPFPDLQADLAASIQFVSAPASKINWTLTAADFVNAWQLAEKNQASAILMLGPDSSSLSAAEIHSLADAVLTNATDLAVAWYELPPSAGLMNSAILYPLSRALFASRVRFPLAPDLGLSPRMAQCMANAAQRFAPSNQSETPIWPVNEVSQAGFTTAQFPVTPRLQAHPNRPDLNTILPLVAGSLFADIDAKAAYWQRFRPLPPPFQGLPSLDSPAIDAATEIAPMLQNFRLACVNLQEIWSLVLPPNSLLGIKRLGTADASVFRIADNLWARIVYDFLLAYRLRTIHRGHLLGALIPLYLAWVASHLNITASGIDPERHIEEVALAFEAEKPYLVSRWRWPDRFNP
jgi:hypothetical protein